MWGEGGCSCHREALGQRGGACGCPCCLPQASAPGPCPLGFPPEGALLADMCWLWPPTHTLPISCSTAHLPTKTWTLWRVTCAGSPGGGRPSGRRPRHLPALRCRAGEARPGARTAQPAVFPACIGTLPHCFVGQHLHSMYVLSLPLQLSAVGPVTPALQPRKRQPAEGQYPGRLLQGGCSSCGGAQCCGRDAKWEGLEN